MPADEALRIQQHAQEQHFTRRAWERLHVKLKPARYHYWVRKVREVLPGTQFIDKQADKPWRTRWLIRAGTLRIKVIYDEHTDRLVTCMAWRDTDYIPHKRFVRRQRKAVQPIRQDHAQAMRRRRTARHAPISDLQSPIFESL